MLALIPAKSTSTRIPNKNMIDVCGHPLIEWTLKACTKWDVVKTIVVATDGNEIARTALKWGAEVMMITDDDINDKRTVSQLWQEFCKSNGGDQVLMFPTNPLRRIEDMNMIWELYKRNNYDVVVSLKEERHLIVGDDGKPMPGEEESRMTRLTQHCRPKYILDGSYILGNSDYIANCSYIEEGNNGIFPMSKMCGLEIDDPEELEIVRMVAKGTDWWNTRLE